jgi:hypothetical protein
MKTAQLAAEMAQAFANLVETDGTELCDELGISAPMLFFAQLVGIAPIRFTGKDDLFEPDPAGELAYITPVCVHYPDTPLTARPDLWVRFGNLIDLVSWCPRHPNTMHRRCGQASWLGAVDLHEPFAQLIHRSVLRWLQSGCEGLVLLGNAEDRRRVLWCLDHGWQAEDRAHQAELEQVLKPPEKPPPITIHREASRDARDHWGN